MCRKTPLNAYANVIHPDRTSQLWCKSTTQKTRNTTNNLTPTILYVLQPLLSQSSVTMPPPAPVEFKHTLHHELTNFECR